MKFFVKGKKDKKDQIKDDEEIIEDSDEEVIEVSDEEDQKNKSKKPKEKRNKEKGKEVKEGKEQGEKEDKEKRSGDEDEEDDDNDDLNERVAKFKKEKNEKYLKKNCIYCNLEIPNQALRCYSCHHDQPVDYLETIQAKTTVEKVTKSFKLYKIAILDDDALEDGVVFSRYIFKIKDKNILSLLPSFATCNYIPKKKHQAYVKARSVIMSMPRIRAYLRSAQAPPAFVNFINEVEKIKELNNTEIQALLKNKKLVFDALYYIFESGAPIFGYKYREKIGAVIKSAHYSDGMFGDVYSIVGATIKANGTTFYYFDENFSICEFPGVMALKDLPVMNLDRRTRKELVQRGEMFQKLGTAHHYQQYTGAMTKTSGYHSIRYKADGRIMVDIVTHNARNPNNQNFAYAANTYGGQTDPNVMETISEDELFITWPTLPGFSFACKQWGEFFVSQISDINFDDKAFLRLVLPEEKKSLIRALVEDHRESIQRLNDKKQEDHKQEFTDIITGKGGGCIFLLHGSPGVGKTLTAEAVSEHLHIPLYMVTVGELGTTPQVLESSLQQILELASTWGASILLDEADIFLEKRSKKDIVRNAMVGIFLRLLEYHQGVLFLTTNRIKCLDEAFSSRISIAIHYYELDQSARHQVWCNFLSMAIGDDEMRKMDIDKLSDYTLNGRQIRSCVRLGQALARTQNTSMSMEHLITTINISVNFKNQFDEIKRSSRAKSSRKKISSAANPIVIEEDQIFDF